MEPFLLNKAKLVKSDIFISSDFKYHDFFNSENEIIIADIGHYESEQFTKELIYDMLVNNFSKRGPVIKSEYKPN